MQYYNIALNDLKTTQPNVLYMSKSCEIVPNSDNCVNIEKIKSGGNIYKNMKFLTNWHIDLSKVSKYSEFKQDFKEMVDYPLALLILEHGAEHGVSPESLGEFKKLVSCIDPNTNMLPVRYSARLEIGRRYADCPSEFYPNGASNPNFMKYYSALIAMPKLIKNTIFAFQKWIDIDQVKGHPTILYEMCCKNHMEANSYKNYLAPGGFDAVVYALIEHHSVEGSEPLNQGDVKFLYNKTIYGGGFNQWCKDVQSGKFKDHTGVIVWHSRPKQMKNTGKGQEHPLYKAFEQDTQGIIDLVYRSNPELKALVCTKIVDTPIDATETDVKRISDIYNHNQYQEKQRKNRVMSYFCGIIENEITYTACKFQVENNYMQKRYYDWGYDGFTFPAPAEGTDLNKMYEDMNDYVRKATGFKTVSMIHKPFKSNEMIPALIDMRRAMTTEYIAELVEKHKQPEAPTPQVAPGMSFEEVATEFEKTHLKIVNKSIFIKETPSQIIVMAKQQIKTSYENLVFERLDRKGATEEVNFIENWLVSNKNQRIKDDVGVYPCVELCPENHFNLWRPFAMELITDYDYKEDEVQFILNHIRILCGNDEAVFKYFIAWIAQMIQFPHIKSICPTLISAQGAGKGSLMKLMGKMLGQEKVFETTTPSRDVWGDFNGRMCNTFLINLNELSKKEMNECEGKFKGLITDPTLTINNKGVNQYDIQSYHRFIGTTNLENPMNTDKTDRRNLIIRSSDEKIGDKDYFKKIHDMLDDVNVVKSCYEYFKQNDDAINFNKLPMPQTEYQTNLKELAVSPELQWLESFTRDHHNEKEVECLGVEIYGKFMCWCESNGIEYHTTAQKLGVKLTNLKVSGINKGKHTNKGDTKIYNITELKKYFKIGAIVLYADGTSESKN